MRKLSCYLRSFAAVFIIVLAVSCEKDPVGEDDGNRLCFTDDGAPSEWRMGEQYLIQWINETGDPVTIELMSGDSAYIRIGTFSHLMTEYNYTVPYDLIPGDDYYLRIFDAEIPEKSDETPVFSLLETANRMPECEIVDPQGGKYITSGDLVVITVEADDPDGEVMLVRFYIDDVFVGETTKTTFLFEWYAHNVSVGLHRIQAVAVDDDGEESVMTSVNVVITDGLPPIKLITVPAGNFLMGSFTGDYDEKPVNRVYMTHDYYMGQFEITNDQFAYMMNYASLNGELTGDFSVTVMNLNGSGKELIDINDEDCGIFYDGGSFRSKDSLGSRPVEEVTWWGAAFYCNMLSRNQNVMELYDLETWECDLEGTGYRLPTEAEWEYAGRYNDMRKYVWGDSHPDGVRANYGNIVGHTTDIGSYSPQGDSRLGICDMAGNVWEWCNDWYGYYPATESFLVDPEGPGPTGLKVLRGGNINSSVYQLRPTYRTCYAMLSGHSYGFRIVLSIR